MTADSGSLRRWAALTEGESLRSWTPLLIVLVDHQLVGDDFAEPDVADASRIVSERSRSLPRRVMPAGCLITFGSAAVTCLMLLINGSLVMAILDSIPNTAPPWARKAGVCAIHAVFGARVAGGRPVDHDRLRSEQIPATNSTMNTNMQLYLIRHAESENNAKPVHHRIEDPPITESADCKPPIWPSGRRR